MVSELNEYQTRAANTAVYPDKSALEYLTLGLVAEAGELAGHYAKWLRKDSQLQPYPAEAVMAEAGDVLWFISELARLHNKSLSDLAQENFVEYAVASFAVTQEKFSNKASP